MGKFYELTNLQIKHLSKNLLVKWLPKSAGLYNITILYLETSLNQIVPTTFFAYNENINGDDGFIVAKQDKGKYSNSVSWTICGPESKYIVSDMFHALECIIDWKISNLFSSVHIDYSCIIRNMCEEHGAMSLVGPNKVYYMDKTFACGINLNTKFKIEDNIYIDKLNSQDIKKLVKYWRFIEDGSFEEEEILDSSILIGSGGVRVNNNKLVSWGFTGTDGVIHCLHTIQNHRGKGYAKMIVQYLSQMIGLKGIYPITQVEDSNIGCIKVMLSSGFQPSHSMYWYWYVPNITNNNKSKNQ